MLSADLRCWAFKTSLRELPNPFMLIESISIRPDHLPAIGRALRRGASWTRRPFLLGVDRDEPPCIRVGDTWPLSPRDADILLPAQNFRFPPFAVGQRHSRVPESGRHPRRRKADLTRFDPLRTIAVRFSHVGYSLPASPIFE